MLLKLLPLLLDTQMGLRLLPEGSREQLLHNCLVICFLRCCTANSSSPLTRPCSEAASALLPNPSRSSWGTGYPAYRRDTPPLHPRSRCPAERRPDTDTTAPTRGHPLIHRPSPRCRPPCRWRAPPCSVASLTHELHHHVTCSVDMISVVIYTELLAAFVAAALRTKL